MSLSRMPVNVFMHFINFPHFDWPFHFEFHHVRSYLKFDELNRRLIVSLSESVSFLSKVLLALKRIIASEKLYDPQNPTVILCDESLENAIDVKALHVSEIRYFWKLFILLL